jgi:hypothetical protein
MRSSYYELVWDITPTCLWKQRRVHIILRALV